MSQPMRWQTAAYVRGHGLATITMTDHTTTDHTTTDVSTTDRRTTGFPAIPSDRQLVEAVRRGHDAAWRELLSRHEGSVKAVLRSRRGSPRRTVTATLDAVRDDLDHPPEGVEAIRAFRPKALAAVTGGAYGPGDADESGDAAVTAVPREHAELLACALGKLPEAWQTVLWHGYVERLSAAEVSPLVGRTVNEVNGLLSTARRGLVDAYLAEYLDAGDFDDETHTLVQMLGGYVRAALPPHELRLVEQHLASADDASVRGGHGPEQSRELIEIATSLPAALPSAVAPGITGLTVAEHRSRLGTAERSFGAATLFANRSDRARRVILVGSVVAVLLAVLGVALLVRAPFEDGVGGEPDTYDLIIDTPDGMLDVALDVSLEPDTDGVPTAVLAHLVDLAT